MIKKIAAGLVVLVVLVCLAAWFQPAEFKISRGTMIDAPAENAFNLVNDFQRWNIWSPWEKLDPNLKRTFEGAPRGEGSIYSWNGNSDAGAGRMTILESIEPSKVKIKLEFFKPFAAVNEAEFTFQAAGPHTLVSWTMTGKSGFLQRLICMFMNMDKMVGGEFEKGLAVMKAAAEGRPL